MSLVDKVLSSVEALRDGQGVEQPDLALVEMLVMLARELDGARAVSRQAGLALDLAREHFPDDPALAERIELLRNQLAERTALDRLSARMLSGFDALGLTPKARAARKVSATPGPVGELGRMRALRGGKS